MALIESLDVVAAIEIPERAERPGEVLGRRKSE